MLTSGGPQSRKPDGSPATAHAAWKPHPMQGWSPDFVPKLTADAVASGVIHRVVTVSGPDAMRWSRERAIRYYANTLGDPLSSATTEVERYCVWPGQACGYMIGKMTLLRLRAHAQQTMGARFDIKKFHDCVLTNGSIPLTVTETVVNDWASGSHA